MIPTWAALVCIDLPRHMGARDVKDVVELGCSFINGAHLGALQQ